MNGAIWWAFIDISFCSTNTALVQIVALFMVEIGSQLASQSNVATKWLPSAIWIGTFGASIIVGFFLTASVADYAVAGLPRTEVYEALHRDFLAGQWTMCGWAFTLAISLLCATVAYRTTKRLSQGVSASARR